MGAVLVLRDPAVARPVHDRGSRLGRVWIRQADRIVDRRHLRRVRLPRIPTGRLDRRPMARVEASDLVRRNPDRGGTPVDRALDRVRALRILHRTGSHRHGNRDCSSRTSPRSSASSIPKADARRDAGFSIYYMGINIGALVAPLITGYLGERVGWHLGFGAAGIGMVIGLITYRLRANKTLGNIGMAPASTDPARAWQSQADYRDRSRRHRIADGADDGRDHPHQSRLARAEDDGRHRRIGADLLHLSLRWRRADHRGEEARRRSSSCSSFSRRSSGRRSSRRRLR